MPVSPYFDNNVGAGWGPQGSAIQEMLNRDSQMAQKGADFLGNMAGGLAGGAIGAFQGKANPSVFGAETTPSQGASQGFWQNFNKYSGFNGNGGNSGGGGGGVGNMINSFANVGQSGSGNMNVKQLLEFGKAADSYRKAVQAGTPTLAGEDHMTFGLSDEEWQAKSALERGQIAAQANYAQVYNQKQSDLMLKAQEAQRYKEQAAAIAAEAEQIKNFRNAYAKASEPQSIPNPTLPGILPDMEFPGSPDVNKLAVEYLPPKYWGEAAQVSKADRGAHSVVEGKTQSGTPYVTFGNTFQFDPSSRAASGEPLESPDGNFYFDGHRWMKKPETQTPGDGPVESPDGKMFWDGKQWRQKRAPGILDSINPGGKPTGLGGAISNLFKIRQVK